MGVGDSNIAHFFKEKIMPELNVNPQSFDKKQLMLSVEEAQARILALVCRMASERGTHHLRGEWRENRLEYFWLEPGS